MRLGISTSCYYPEHLEFAVKNLVEHQVACIEVFVNTVSEFEPGFIRLLQGILQGGNTEVVSVHPFTSGMEFVLFFTDYQRRVDDGVEMYRKYFDVCSRLGGKYVVFHGVRRDIPCEDGVYFERFQLLYESARSMGVELLQENVARCKSGDPAFIQKMRKALGEQAHFVLDTKQCVRRGVELEQMRAVMGDALRHVHLSDCDVNHDRCV